MRLRFGASRFVDLLLRFSSGGSGHISGKLALFPARTRNRGQGTFGVSGFSVRFEVFPPLFIA